MDEEKESGSAPPRAKGILFTIGHSNHSPEVFLDLLRSNGIEILVDVRSSPYSGYTPHFNGEELKPALKTAGIEYLFFGKELGGRPPEERYYDSEGHVLYSKLAKTADFQKAVDRLKTGISKYRVAILCGEEDPSECHRRLLVGRVMDAGGAEVRHIRGDGRVQTEGELKRLERERRGNVGQDELFPESEDRTWRSIRSVLQKSRPASSSEL